MSNPNRSFRGIAVLMTMNGAGIWLMPNLTAFKTIAGVMLRGRWLSRADIDTILARLESPAN